MWRKIVRVAGFMLAVALIVAYICYALHLAQEHRAEQRVEEVVISMSDSTRTQLFATSEQIRKQLKRGGLRIVNEVVDSVDAVKISEYITNNGFVSGTDVYVTYSGKVYIDVKQHKPIMRLLCGGQNSYITTEGEVFRSPQGSAYYTSVVTGGYSPLFGANYEGNIASNYKSLMAKEDSRIVKLGEQFAAIKRERGLCMAKRADLRKQRKQGLFESDESHKQRKVGIDMELAACDEQLKALKARKLKVEREQQRVELRKKKIKKKYEDFANLINFVTKVSDDSFWSAEVVQFIADTTSTGEISIQLVPRSGDFVVEFGTLADSDEKLHKLEQFYDDGLSQIGWNRYKIVDVRYNKQVICTE